MCTMAREGMWWWWVGGFRTKSPASFFARSRSVTSIQLLLFRHREASKNEPDGRWYPWQKIMGEVRKSNIGARSGRDAGSRVRGGAGDFSDFPSWFAKLVESGGT